MRLGDRSTSLLFDWRVQRSSLFYIYVYTHIHTHTQFQRGIQLLKWRKLLERWAGRSPRSQYLYLTLVEHTYINSFLFVLGVLLSSGGRLGSVIGPPICNWASLGRSKGPLEAHRRRFFYLLGWLTSNRTKLQGQTREDHITC